MIHSDTCADCGRDLALRSHASDCSQLVVRCEECGERVAQGQTNQIDVSLPDEYYPEFIHLCHACDERSVDTATDRDGGDT